MTTSDGLLLVVRHGLAVAPDDWRLPGPDVPLRAEGQRQIAALAERLTAFRPVGVWVSDARRARESGEIIATRCGVELHVQPALRELDFGCWGGRTYAEVVAADPAAAAFFQDPTDHVPPAGECARAAARRVLDELERLAALPASPQVVVGHAGSLRLALALGLGLPLAAYWRFQLDCGGMSCLRWAGDALRIEALNDTAHLGQLGWTEGERRGERQQRPPKKAEHDMGGSDITLILGGVRSGKSALAERLARDSGRPVLYVATAQALDAELAARIAQHQARRPVGWRTVEAPMQLTSAIAEHAQPGEFVLLDCLTVWLGNRFVEGIGVGRDTATVTEAEWTVLEEAAIAEVVALCRQARAQDLALALVSNEVGMGVVPASLVGRRYRDALGRVNQAAAATADAVLLLIAGLVLDLKQIARPVILLPPE